ncbi:conserved hypothetical protein [Ricinus communis]|uniref:AIR12 DOMON domain-containing protein n=1 Tax=Ricinus communis TaxID=3988 RepID=B9T493_RICCO|nr:conserved hypothetical protein [Ricinus communis]|eukprot:XP_025015550.1 auxin-induced in root cultures protein 12-like [Ricinus communis]
MIESQALVALKSNDSLIIKTNNIISYASLQESKLSFDVWDVSAESYEGKMVIFATVRVPEMAERLNQVWQVGSAVSGCIPDRHDMADANKILRECWSLWLLVVLPLFLFLLQNNPLTILGFLEL